MMETAIQDKIIEKVSPDNYYFCNICFKKLIEGQMKDHLKGNPHLNEVTFKVLHQPDRQWDSLTTQHIPKDIRKAAQSKFIIVNDRLIICRKCSPSKSFSGLEPLIKHYRTHPAMQTDFIKTQTDSKKKQTDSKKKSTDSKKMPFSSQPSAPVSRVSKSTPTDLITKEFEKVVSNVSSFYMSNLMKLETPHGDTGRIFILSSAFYVLVFNNIFRGHSERERQGAHYDSENIKRVFGKLNCIIDIQEDKTKAETENIIKNLTGGSVLQNAKKLICFILSHGAKGFYVQTCDEENTYMHIDNIRLAFKDSRCQALIGKPKIFFVNSCRGKYSEKSFETDGERETDAPNEMVTFYASINGYVAIRDTTKGTVFVSSVCQTIEEYPNAKLVEDFKLKLIQKTKENGGGTIECQDYSFTKSGPLHM